MTYKVTNKDNVEGLIRILDKLECTVLFYAAFIYSMAEDSELHCQVLYFTALSCTLNVSQL